MNKNTYLAVLIAFLMPGIIFAQVIYPNRGGTGTSSIPTEGYVLVAQSNGTYGPVATSSLNISVVTTGDWTGTLDGIEGAAFALDTDVDDLSGVTSVSTARTNLNVDVAGTDNSTNVFLTGTPNYITITGQAIARALIDLTSHVTGILPIANGGTGASTALGAFNALKQVASATYNGVVELATSAETTTGTDTGRAITPDGLAGSDFGKRSTSVIVLEVATALTVADGLATFPIPDGVGGMNLVGVHAYVNTAGTTGLQTFQIHNLTQTADMLSTKITIDTTETTSRTAATAPVIDSANDDVADGDIIRIDSDVIQTTAALGLMVELVFQLP